MNKTGNIFLRMEAMFSTIKERFCTFYIVLFWISSIVFIITGSGIADKNGVHHLIGALTGFLIGFTINVVVGIIMATVINIDTNLEGIQKAFNSSDLDASNAENLAAAESLKN